MKRKTKILTSSIILTSLIAPSMIYANNTDNKNINIDIDKKTVLLGDTSNVSVSFKDNIKADSITLNFLCYDMPLSATLNYNEETKSYQGQINFNKDPEYLNIWNLENITINNKDNKKVLNKEDLEKEGLNLDDYKITQEYILTSTPQSMNRYIQKTGAPVKKLIGEERQDTAVKISQEGWKTGSDKVIIVNGNAIADGITATPLATTYNAPILLTYKDILPKSTIEELKRLNPSEVILIGGSNVISDDVKEQIQKEFTQQETKIKTKSVDTKDNKEESSKIEDNKEETSKEEASKEEASKEEASKEETSNTEDSIKKEFNIRRIYGNDRHETSLKIAQEIDNNHDVEKIYISNGYKGEVDALTIAAKAGADKQPIILSEKEKLPDLTYDWLKNEKLKDAYFIGGEAVLDTNIIHQMAGITNVSPGQSVYKNRVYGDDRHETNAKVIEKFYPQEKLNAVLVAKSDVLVDALTAGPLAAKLNSPIIINPTNYVSKYHEKNLEDKSADIVYQVGGGIKDKIINDIAYKLSIRTNSDKTVVVDPGHGGSDSGMTKGSHLEKNYTLDTSLATAQYLRDNGINVILSRDTDKTLALGSRTHISNTIKPDLFTSIHYNASNGAGHGVEVFYKTKDKSGGTTKTAATNVINSILQKFDLRDRGIKTRTLDNGQDYLYVLRNNNAPAILVECAFIDNTNDLKLIDELHERQEMGTQIAKGIEKTLK